MHIAFIEFFVIFINSPSHPCRFLLHPQNMGLTQWQERSRNLYGCSMVSMVLISVSSATSHRWKYRCFLWDLASVTLDLWSPSQLAPVTESHMWTACPGLHLTAWWLGFEPTTCWSQVQHLNHLATEPHKVIGDLFETTLNARVPVCSMPCSSFAVMASHLRHYMTSFVRQSLPSWCTVHQLGPAGAWQQIWRGWTHSCDDANARTIVTMIYRQSHNYSAKLTIHFFAVFWIKSNMFYSPFYLKDQTLLITSEIVLIS